MLFVAEDDDDGGLDEDAGFRSVLLLGLDETG